MERDLFVITGMVDEIYEIAVAMKKEFDKGDESKIDFIYIEDKAYLISSTAESLGQEIEYGEED